MHSETIGKPSYIFNRKEKRGSSTKEVGKQCKTRGKKETQEKM
jgi:hypothetical protein